MVQLRLDFFYGIGDSVSNADDTDLVIGNVGGNIIVIEKFYNREKSDINYGKDPQYSELRNDNGFGDNLS